MDIMIGMSTDAFLIALVQIIAIDIVLGGDNAIIIALACRNLPMNSSKDADEFKYQLNKW